MVSLNVHFLLINRLLGRIKDSSMCGYAFDCAWDRNADVVKRSHAISLNVSSFNNNFLKVCMQYKEKVQTI